MKTCIVSIADAEETARSLGRYVQCFFGDQADSYFMTYKHNLLSGTLMRNTDLFILELLRHDDLGYRAESIFVAEKWLPIGKRILIISGTTVSGNLNTSLYWDLSSPDRLHERIRRVLNEPIIAISQLEELKIAFKRYCRPAIDHH